MQFARIRSRRREKFPITILLTPIATPPINRAGTEGATLSSNSLSANKKRHAGDWEFRAPGLPGPAHPRPEREPFSVTRERNTWALVGANGELVGASFPLRNGFCLGRSITADLFLPDPNISRHHARIEELEGEYCLVRCAPHAVLKVNGQFVERHSLRSGDAIEIGRFRLDVQRLDAAAPSRRTPSARFRAAASQTSQSTISESSPSAGRPMPSCGIGENAASWSKGPTTRRPRTASTTPAASPAASGLEQQGFVLSACLTSPQESSIPELSQRLAARIESWVASTGGTLVRSHLTRWQIYWDQAKCSREDLATQVLGTAMVLHRLAFSEQDPGLAASFSIGIASGLFHLGDRKAGDANIWGGAADRALQYAMNAPRGGVCLVPSELFPPVMIDRQPMRIGDSQETPQQIHGFEHPSEGRRRRYVVSLPVQLEQGSHLSPALITRIVWDPQQGLFYLAAAIGHAIDSDVPATLHVADDRVIPVDCVSVKRGLSERSSIVVLTLTGSLATIRDLFEIEIIPAPEDQEFRPAGQDAQSCDSESMAA